MNPFEPRLDFNCFVAGASEASLALSLSMAAEDTQDIPDTTLRNSLAIYIYTRV